MDARGVRHEKIMEATDAVGWRVDMLIEAQPYFDRWVSTADADHLGFHSSHLQRLVTRDKGFPEFRALADLIMHVRRRFLDVKTPVINVGCYCDKGAVESVGLTWFLMQWPVVRCQRLHGPGACRECAPDTDSEPRRRLKAILRHAV